jgi:glycosyltransferase involved in cell wall biosynthesis
VGFQRNLGAKNAQGKYLVFLDADVTVSPTFLEELHISSLKNHWLFATTWITPDSKKSTDKFMLLLGNLVQELAKGVNKPYSGGYNTIVDKQVFLNVGGFREDLKINEDHDFAVRVCKKGYELTTLKEPQVVFSLRRFRSTGTLKLLRKLAEGEIRHWLQGPITSELFDYPMGGHVHQKKHKKKIDLSKVDTYLKGIAILEKKIGKVLREI